MGTCCSSDAATNDLTTPLTTQQPEHNRTMSGRSAYSLHSLDRTRLENDTEFTFAKELLPQLEAARAAADQKEEARLLNLIGYGYAHAHASHANISTNDDSGQGGDFNSALKYHQMHLQVAENLVDQKHVRVASSNVGLAMTRLGRWDEAVQYQKNALIAAQATETLVLRCGGLKRMLHHHAEWSSKGTFKNMLLAHVEPPCAVSHTILCNYRKSHFDIHPN